ncbi:MAG: hypothetical protein EBT80_04045 [Chitinophagales bacterium]|nr:hypothetical protein [Chitinophagales bacterium]
MKTMKKIVFSAIIAISIVACTQKGVNSSTEVNSHQFGENYDSTAYMDVIKATFKDVESYDSVAYRTRYTDTAIFHDNDKILTLNENVALQGQFIAAGIKAKVKDDYVMWGSHFNCFRLTDLIKMVKLIRNGLYMTSLK